MYINWKSLKEKHRAYNDIWKKSVSRGSTPWFSSLSTLIIETTFLFISFYDVTVLPLQRINWFSSAFVKRCFCSVIYALYHKQFFYKNNISGYDMALFQSSQNLNRHSITSCVSCLSYRTISALNIMSVSESFHCSYYKYFHSYRKIDGVLIKRIMSSLTFYKGCWFHTMHFYNDMMMKKIWKKIKYF